MIIVILPAIDGLRLEWREAAGSLGASKWQFWRYVAIPLLAPAFTGALLLLFANSIAAYANQIQHFQSQSYLERESKPEKPFPYCP